METFLGTILMWPINFAPQNWLFCHGQLLPISQYTALFSLIGTTYGGDGRTTFALPNLQGRTPIGTGQGYGTSNYYLGEVGGSERTQLDMNSLPSHSHVANTSGITVTTKVSAEDATTSEPSENTTLAKAVNGRETFPIYKPDGTPTVNLNTGAEVSGNVSIENTGSSQPFPVIQPFIGMHFIICVDGGFYPPRP